MQSKKRLLYLSNSYPLTVSGVSTVVNNLLEWMPERYTTAIICPNTNTRYLKQNRGNLTLYRLPSYPSPLRHDFRFITPNPIQVQKAFEDFEPDLIHLHDPSPASIILKDLAFKKNLPVIISHHFTSEMILGYLPEALRELVQDNPQLNELILSLTCRLYKDATHLVTPSLTTKNNLSPHTKIPISVISSGVDYQYFRDDPDSKVAQKYHLPHKPFVFYLGRLDPEKNLSTLLQAWALLPSRSDYNLVIAGDGSQSDTLKQIARDLKIYESIIWTGLVKQADLVSIYRHPQARVFVIPSPTETQSIVTLYALAAGLPVIAANAGALPELVKNNKNGYLVSTSQPQEYAHKLQNLLSNPDLCSKLGAKGSKIALKHDYPNVIKKYHTLYDQTLL